MSRSSDFVFMWSSTLLMPSYWASPAALRDRIRVFVDADMFQYFDGRIVTAYMRERDLDRIRFWSRRNRNPSRFRAYRLEYLQEHRAWWKWIRQIERKGYRSPKRTELVEDHRLFTRSMRDAIAYFGSTRTEYTYAVEQRLEALLRSRFGLGWADAFTSLSTPVVMDEVQREHLAWLSIRQSTDAVLLRHTSRYPWLVVGQFDEPGVLVFLRRRWRTEERLKPSIERRAMTAKFRARRREQARIMRAFSRDRREAAFLATFLQTQAYERMRIKAYWAGCYYLARRLWVAIANALDLSVADVITYVTPPEVERWLRTGHGVARQELARRRRALVLVRRKDGQTIRVASGREATALFRRTVRFQVGHANVIRGQPASLGSYTGRVRKVEAGDLEMLQASIKAFRPGEVLVTSMTQPNMMVIARRAGAIVADEGGITSHAAIISRELKIPCIVGCQHAMQVLEDGDQVEVDATEGIVRKV